MCVSPFFSWPRPSGSDSDSDDEVGTAHQTGSAVRSVSAVGHPHAVGNTGHPGVRVRAHPMAAQINSTPSPQLSLAEFLKDE